MRDGLTHHEGRDKVLHGPSFSTMGTKHEGVETTLVPQMVQHRDIGVHVVDVVGVRGVLTVRPLIRGLQDTQSW